MRSKTSCFNGAIFRKNLQRFWPIWGIYLVVWLLMLPVPLGSMLSGGMPKMEMYEAILRVAATSGPVMSFAFACASAMAVFSFLYSMKSVCMLSALPTRREGLYLTSFLSGLVWMLGANLLVFLVALLVGAGAGVAGVLLQWLAMVSLQVLLFYGFACLCATLTGHIVVLPLVYVVLNFTAVAVERLLKEILGIFVYGAGNGSGTMRTLFLSPLVRLARGGVGVDTYDALGQTAPAQVSYGDWPLLAVYGAVGLVCALAGLLIFRRRHMETASDVVAVPCLKPVFKYCMALGCALVLGSLFYGLIFADRFVWVGAAGWLLLCVLAGGFVGYFAAEMLIRKSFRVFTHAWKGFAVFAFALVALVLCGETDITGYERWVPPVDQVETVWLDTYGESARLEERENIKAVLALHESIIAHKADSEEALLDMEGYGVDHAMYVSLDYGLKDGRRVCRAYWLPYYDGDLKDKASLSGQTGAILNSEEARLARKELSLPVEAAYIDYASVNWYNRELDSYESLDLSPEEAEEFYRSCILPDLLEGGLGRVWLANDADYYATVYAASISIDLSRQTRDQNNMPHYEYDYFWTTPTVDSRRTNAWLAERGVELVLERDSYTEIEVLARESGDEIGTKDCRGGKHPRRQAPARILQGLFLQIVHPM